VIRLKTIDAHVGGEPLRLIVDGFPSPGGSTMREKRRWLERHAEHLRRTVMLEPRGHADMYGAVLTEPVSPGSHAGVLFMHNDGYSAMSGHGIIAATTIALERGLLMPGPAAPKAAGRPEAGGDGSAVVFDTPAGIVRASAHFKPGTAGEAGKAGRVESVSFANVPSFVLHGGLAVRVGHRQIRADVAFGGEFYAIVDAESVGLPIDARHLPELRRAGIEIARTIEASQAITHPLDATVSGLDATIFTGPARDAAADLRNVTVFADGQVDRSPCGTGTAAVMAVVDAMGLLAGDRAFVHESIIGTRLTGRVTGRTTVGEQAAIVAEIEGAAWITGEQTFLVDADDPLRGGFRI
jgi:trans-L-3-hydroxyproline dehydratase